MKLHLPLKIADLAIQLGAFVYVLVTINGGNFETGAYALSALIGWQLLSATVHSITRPGWRMSWMHITYLIYVGGLVVIMLLCIATFVFGYIALFLLFLVAPWFVLLYIVGRCGGGAPAAQEERNR